MTNPYDHRQVLCDWLTANGVNAREVPLDSEIYIETAEDGTRTLHCSQCLTDVNGGRYFDERLDVVAMEQVSVPLTTEPPAWWQPYRKPTRDQLLDAAFAVLQLHRAADHGGRVICAGCSALDDQGSTDNAPVAYPCATVTALGSLPTITTAQLIGA